MAALGTAEGKELQLKGTASSSSCPRGARDVMERLLGASERRAGGGGHWRATQAQGPPESTARRLLDFRRRREALVPSARCGGGERRAGGGGHWRATQAQGPPCTRYRIGCLARVRTMSRTRMFLETGVKREAEVPMNACSLLQETSRAVHVKIGRLLGLLLTVKRDTEKNCNQISWKLRLWGFLNSETGHSEDREPNLRHALGSVKRVTFGLSC